MPLPLPLPSVPVGGVCANVADQDGAECSGHGLDGALRVPETAAVPRPLQRQLQT